MKKQIIVIGGGTTFDSYRQYIEYLRSRKISRADFEKMKTSGWKDSLGKDLGRGYEIILPKMPNPSNAKYAEWKIWWEKIISHLEKEVILVGHSLGGIFLAKYLSENKFPKKIRAVFLVAAPFDDEDADGSLADFTLKKDLGLLIKQADAFFIYQSIDDVVVSRCEFDKYKKAAPGGNFRLFKRKGHFNQKRFPELAREIKKVFA